MFPTARKWRHPGYSENGGSMTIDPRVGQTKNNKKMKTLGKLKLKEEKMLNPKELLGFRGGSGGSCTGTYYVCSSGEDAFIEQCRQNCGSNCQYVNYYVISGC